MKFNRFKMIAGAAVAMGVVMVAQPVYSAKKNQAKDKNENAISNKSVLSKIDSRVLFIDKATEKLKGKQHKVYQDKKEGLEVVSFSDSTSSVIKVVAEFKSSNSLRTETYYYQGQELIFCLRNEKYASEADKSKDVVREEEYKLYYNGGKMIKMLETIVTNVDPSEDDYNDTEADGINSSDYFLEIVKGVGSESKK